MATSLAESMLGLGVGASALMATAGTQLQQWTIPGLIAAGVIASIMAILVGSVQAFFMRQPIHQWRLWAVAAGSEVYLLWLFSFCGAITVGRVFGLTTIACAFAGVVTAAIQSLLLKQQVAHSVMWFIISTIAWLLASCSALAVEMTLPDPVLGVIWSIALGRLVYGALSSAAIAWLIESSEQRSQAQTT